MFYSIYNFISNMPFLLFIVFYVALITAIFVFCTIKNIKRIKAIEEIKKTKNKGQYFVALMFCSVSLLVKRVEIEYVLGGACLLLGYILATNFFQNAIQNFYINKNNKKDSNINYFEKAEDVIERSKKILSTIRTTTKPTVSVEKEQPNDKISFSHVKSVIKKLQNYSLNQTEKRQVEELSYAMYALENGNCNENEKSKLNEGLNSLLKIMAKYSI